MAFVGRQVRLSMPGSTSVQVEEFCSTWVTRRVLADAVALLFT
jgi:hypothetical protein